MKKIFSYHDNSFWVNNSLEYKLKFVSAIFHVLIGFLVLKYIFFFGAILAGVWWFLAFFLFIEGLKTWELSKKYNDTILYHFASTYTELIIKILFSYL